MLRSLITCWQVFPCILALGLGFSSAAENWPGWRGPRGDGSGHETHLPVYQESSGLVFITGGFPDHHILAIRPNGTGNVTPTHIVWRTTEGAAYVPSPIIEGNYLLVVSDSGVAHCFEARTGKLAWKERLGEQHASLVSAEGRVYFLNDKGVMNVVKAGPQFERVAQNPIGEKCLASPAISHGQIFLRGEKHLFCIGQEQGGARARLRGALRL